MTPREKLAALMVEVNGLIETAEKAGRPFDAKESARVAEIKAEAEACQAQIKAADEAQALLKDLAVDTDDIDFDDPFSGLNVHKKTAVHPIAKAFTDRALKTENAYGQKALLPAGEETIPVGLPMLAMRRPQDSLIPLMSTRELTAPTFSYLRQITRAATSAAFVSRGALKPVSAKPDLERVDGKVSTIAHLFEGIDREHLADVDSLQQFITEEMVYGLNKAVDAALLTGNGVDPNPTGLLSTTGVLQQAFATDVFTTTRSAKSQLEMDESPTAWAMHPADWQVIELTRDADQRFLLSSAAPQRTVGRTLWDLPVVLCRDIPQGTAVLGDWRQAVLYVRQGIQMAWSEMVGENFRRNQLSFRCEARLGFGVLRPSAFVVVDLTAA